MVCDQENQTLLGLCYHGAYRSSARVLDLQWLVSQRPLVVADNTYQRNHHDCTWRIPVHED